MGSLNSLLYPRPALHPYLYSRETRSGISYATFFPAFAISRNIILFSHGNASQLSDYIEWATRIAQTTGCQVVIYDYPGYGKTPGQPCESRNVAAGLEVYREVIGTAPVILVGESLGTGVTCRLAHCVNNLQGVILISVFKSIPQVIWENDTFEYLARTLNFDVYPNWRLAPAITGPVHYIHGSHDTLVHYSHGLHVSVGYNFHLLECNHNETLSLATQSGLLTQLIKSISGDSIRSLNSTY